MALSSSRLERVGGDLTARARDPFMSTTPENGDGPHTVRQLVTPEEFALTYRSWSREITEAMEPLDGWAIIGVKRRGSVLARRLHDDLDPEGTRVPFGEVDISLYRDDYHLQASSPRVLGTEIEFSVENLSILLVDDVLYTGRTVRAALNVILDFGRPKRIWLGVFVDRGHRELPVSPNFTGRVEDTLESDRVEVRLVELGDGSDRVDLESGAPQERA